MTIVITWYMSGRFRAIAKRLDAHDEALTTLAAQLSGTATKEGLADGIAAVGRQIIEQGREIAALRSDLTHVALAVGARTRPATG